MMLFFNKSDNMTVFVSKRKLLAIKYFWVKQQRVIQGSRFNQKSKETKPWITTRQKKKTHSTKITGIKKQKQISHPVFTQKTGILQLYIYF